MQLGGTIMPKFLVEASYTAEGLKGLQKDKAAGRTAAVKNALKALDGQLEALYWCLGERDAILIVDLPDTAAAAALATAASASGLVRTKTTRLLSAAELDAALQKSVDYRAPGR
jgi:uncharacterized protein with GYD domain